MTTVHGGFDTAELRAENLTRDQVLDFSSNINPLGPSPRVRQAAAEADLSAYPDRECLDLREALAAELGVGIDQLMVGNGSTELIHLLARAHLRDQSRCLKFAPTFGEYEAAAALAGAEIERLRAAAADEALPGGVCCGSPPQWPSPEPWLGVAVVSLERAVETRCALADVLGL